MNPQQSDLRPDRSDGQPDGTPPRKRRRPLWVRLLCGLGWTIAGVIALVLILLTVAVSYLKPERLTPLIEKLADNYLTDADLDLGRVEISFWHTFPRFELDIRDLRVNSRALHSLPDDIRTKLPASTDSLLSVDHLNGAIDIPALMAGKITLYDILTTSPRVNIVQATPARSNLDIFPPSEPKKDDTPLNIPDITIGTFTIDGKPSFSYISLPDSIDLKASLTSTRLEGGDAPDYTVELSGSTTASLPDFTLPTLRFGLGGEIRWSQSAPTHLGLKDFRLSAGEVTTTVTADFDFTDGLTVNNLSLNLPQTPASAIVALVPDNLAGELAKIEAGFDVRLNLNLTRSYTLSADSKLPSFDLDLFIPEGHAAYDRLILSRFALHATASIDGDRPDASEINVKRLLAVGPGVGFELCSHITTPISDPTVEGTFKGGVDISRLPKKLLEQFPFTVSGNLRADSRFAFRKSYLDKDNFHRIRLTGEATLHDLKAGMPELPADIYSHEIRLRLGTNSSFTRGEVSVDSLLTASLMIDTISASVTGMELRGAGIKMGVGCKNTASSADTTLINPIGARIVAERLIFRSTEDSMRIRLRHATVGATLRRFKEDTSKPQLSLNVATDGAFYADRVNRALLSKAMLFVTAHPVILPEGGQRRSSRIADSIAAVHPELPADSVRVLAAAIRAERRKSRAASDSAAVASGEVIDIGVDNSMRRLLRQWEARGILKAERARLFTPYFPLRNTLSDLNVRFNSDSLTVTDTRFRAGHTEVIMNGSISNITRALTSLTHRQPLKLDFTLAGDTIEVNEIAAAVFAGASFAERDSAATAVATPDTENEQQLQAAIERGSAEDSDSTMLLVVPSNIEAAIRIKAANITYSDLMFSDFMGNLNVFEGAINLDSLRARTKVGSINLNALYSAPKPSDASFAFGIRLKDFHVRQFLDLVPAIDSLMPLLYDIEGVINADLAATTRIDRGMNLDIPSLKAALSLSGDSLVLIDRETFRKIGKWLMFKQKDRNVIDHMKVEMIVRDSKLELFPFIFDMDRYKLGVMGSNDLAMNLNYHVSVLKSPLPFKFGINISGNVDDMKIRVGKAKFNEKNMPKSVAIADTTRINLVREIGNIFRRGVRGAAVSGALDIPAVNGNGSLMPAELNVNSDTISRTDSLYFMQQGLIERPDSIPSAITVHNSKDKKSSVDKNKKTKKSRNKVR